MGERFVPQSFYRKMKDIFSYTRNVYFPSWDKSLEWTLCDLSGNCIEYSTYSAKTKEIQIDLCVVYQLVTVYELCEEAIVALMIHEIAHAATRRKLHELRWAAKMFNALKIARSTKNLKTARLIQAELMSNFMGTVEDIENQLKPKKKIAKLSARSRRAKRVKRNDAA